MAKTFVLTDESVNCYGYRVITSGLGLKQFKKNPVMLYAHDHQILPIGTWANIRSEEGKLMADAVFDEGDELAMEVQRKVESGVLRCCSIGFEILQLDDSEEMKLAGQTGPTVTKGELLECSICAIGANRNAMVLSLGAVPLPIRLTAGARVHLDHAENINQGGDAPKNDTEMTENEKQEMEQLRQQVETLKQELEGVKTERDALKQQVAAAEESRIEGLLNAALRDGRITEAQKPQWKSLLHADPQSAEAMLEELSGRKSLSAALEQCKAQGTANLGDKSWDELDRAGQLAELKEKDPETFKGKYQEKFGVEYK